MWRVPTARNVMTWTAAGAMTCDASERRPADRDSRPWCMVRISEAVVVKLFRLASELQELSIAMKEKPP